MGKIILCWVPHANLLTLFRRLNNSLKSGTKMRDHVQKREKGYSVRPTLKKKPSRNAMWHVMKPS